MIPHLPPIQTLRAFEAAARHLNYSRAADELCLTHGAISHHIGRLEKELGGVRLFVRDGQRMLLTDAGQVFVMEVREGLRALTEAVENARTRPRRNGANRVLSVSVLPSFAARWLVPRLASFQASHPEIDIAIHPTSNLAALDGRDGIDLAIRYGPGRWPGLNATPLMKSFIFPVCSPEFLARTRINSPEDLLKFTLLRNPRQKWRPWFLAAGLDVPEPVQGPVFDDAALLLQAAAAGQGAALARSALAMDDLSASRLVRLSDIEIEDDYGWFLVWREPLCGERTDVEAFTAWLRHKAQYLKGPSTDVE
ncbi:transcriptional regulator GcvA [Pseudomonas yamanorum]|uniref:transcriptional regulator GcvA n=1 Tax=Pseudomonas yamanorum TaxID=515393 RepID=UPI00210D0466|nr:transcriptional regulator GcvA [Pseudomonas yamanorum]